MNAREHHEFCKKVFRTFDRLESILHQQWSSELTALADMLFRCSDLTATDTLAEVIRTLSTQIDILIDEHTSDKSARDLALLNRCSKVFERAAEVAGTDSLATELAVALAAATSDDEVYKVVEKLETFLNGVC